MVTTSGPAGPEPTGASTHPNGFVGWLDEHVFPGLREAAADANKGRKVLPLIVEFLPKVVALAEKEPQLAADAQDILSIIESL